MVVVVVVSGGGGVVCSKFSARDETNFLDGGEKACGCLWLHRYDDAMKGARSGEHA